MIRLLVGDNSFEIAQAVDRLVADFDGRPERIDGSELELYQLPDLLMGATLFAPTRLVIIKRLSDNKAVWSALGDWLDRVSDDTQLVLVEPKIDKRSALYKRLHAASAVQEYKAWSERDQQAAGQRVKQAADAMGLKVDVAIARHLVKRVGVDQWALYRALEKLALLDTVTPATIDAHIDAQPTENVFNLFEAALGGDRARVRHMLETLARTEDPYRLFGLLSGQAVQLAALAVTTQSPAEVAHDLGLKSPFGLKRLAPYAKRLGRPGARAVVCAFTEADQAMKTSVAEPWLLIERALIKVGRAKPSRV